jgi:hypothetical protein
MNFDFAGASPLGDDDQAMIVDDLPLTIVDVTLSCGT